MSWQMKTQILVHGPVVTPPYGVYVKQVEKGIHDYFIYAKMFEGARFLKGDEYDYEH